MSRASALSPYQMFRLDLACRPIYEAYGTPPYLVGSVLNKRHPRDIDVRLILEDKTYKKLIPTPKIRTMLSFALTAYLASETGLPIDFGIQSQSTANRLHKGPRNPLGGRILTNWTGDAP